MKNENDAPRAPDNWVSTQMLLDDGVVGGHTRLNRLFAMVRDTLISELVANENYDRNDAVRKIDASMIGMKKPARGPTALFMSPRFVAMLESSGQIRYRWDLPPPPEEGWRSASTMTPAGGPSTVNMKGRMQRLGKELTADIITATGATPTEAEAIVERFLIGLRSPPTGGTATLYASSDAQRILEDTKPPKWSRRVKGEEPPIQGGPSSQGR